MSSKSSPRVSPTNGERRWPRKDTRFVRQTARGATCRRCSRRNVAARHRLQATREARASPGTDRRARPWASGLALSLPPMKTTFLDFEQPIAELEAKIEELRYVQDDSALDISEEISRLQRKSQALTRDIYGKLSAWQIALVARHPQRPYTLDYANGIFTGFEEL